MQHCERATPVQREFIEISRRATFQNTLMHVLEFLTELQSTEIYLVILLRSDSTTDAFPVISKILGTLTEKVCGGVSFH